MRRMALPIEAYQIKELKAGDELFLSGVVYTARDAAHKRMAGLVKDGKALPISLKKSAIYYTGPTPPPPGMAIGACGPTTSLRMDKFTPALIKKGLRVMIGKGRRSREVRDAIRKYNALYLIAPAGCGALLAKSVVSAHLVAYNDLGPEAIYELKVKDFPVVVGIDACGRDIFSG